MQDRTSAETEYHVISLSDAQFAAFCGRNSAACIPFRHFTAVDGAKMTESPQAIGLLAPGITNYSNGALGCAVSHRALWKQCAASAKNIVIFEDDAIVRHDFMAQVDALMARGKPWDVIFFGCNTDTVVSIPSTGGINLTGHFSTLYPSPAQLAGFVEQKTDVSLLRLKFAFGLCGYAVSPKGADKLIERCFPMDNRPVYIDEENRSFPAYGIDCMMVSAYPSIGAFMCFPPLVMTPNDQTTSQTVKA